MKNRKFWGWTAIVSFIAFFVVPILLVLGVYNCAGKNLAVSSAGCDSTLSDAQSRVHMGYAVQIITGTIFVLSLVMYVRLRQKTKP